MRRLAAVAAASIVIAGVAAYALRESSPGSFDPGSAPSLAQMSDRIGSDVMRLIVNGNVPARTGEILLIPKPNFYLGPDVSLTAIDTDRPVLFTSHPNPWAYLARVPLIVYGPGIVDQGGRSFRAVDLTALAPTYARLIGLDRFEAEGEFLPDGIDYGAAPPKLIFTIVIDGGGWNVLQQFPSAWPNITEIASRGVLYENANIGSFPAQTGSIHANIGTGSYPKTHGIAYNFYFERADPKYLKVNTIGDEWDLANENRAIVGTISVLSNHLAMIGHGSALEGGDPDIGVVWDDVDSRWVTNERFYRLPDYIGTMDYGRLQAYEAALDRRDGIDDGTWFGNLPAEIRKGLRRASIPSFERYEGDDVVELLANESLGRDDVADLFYVQFKSPDQAGHSWNMVNPEVGDVLAEADRQIGRIKGELDRRVGAGNYVMVITADHGQQPLAQSVGGWMINSKELERDLEARFGGDFRVRSHYVNIVETDATNEEVARFVSTYTIGDNIPEGIPGEDRVSEARRKERCFAGAFPTGYLKDLSENDIEDFGKSRWREGDLTIDIP